LQLRIFFTPNPRSTGSPYPQKATNCCSATSNACFPCLILRRSKSPLCWTTARLCSGSQTVKWWSRRVGVICAFGIPSIRRKKWPCSTSRYTRIEGVSIAH
jgi:hypothetical protein